MLTDKASWYWIGSKELPDDVGAVEAIVDFAVDHGINVFEAEPRLTAALRKYPRDAYYLYSGCDIYELDESARIADRVASQLEACGEEYIDFYLLSYLNEATTDNVIADIAPKTMMDMLMGDAFQRKSMRTSGKTAADEVSDSVPVFNEAARLSELAALKESGKISFAGVYFTGLASAFTNFIDRHPDGIDFYAFNINYIDWYGQESYPKYMAARIRNIPVVAINPTKSGLLESVPAEAEAYIKELRPESDPFDWCINWVKSVSNPAHTAIEPSSAEDIARYLNVYENSPKLNGDEDCATLSIADRIKGLPENLPWLCINCLHCVQHCPEDLNIGYMMTMYKNLTLQMDDKLVRQYRSLPASVRASACVSCGSCVKFCQERLLIPRFLAELEKLTE